MPERLLNGIKDEVSIVEPGFIHVGKRPTGAAELRIHLAGHAHDADRDAAPELPADVVLQLPEGDDAGDVDPRHAAEVPHDGGEGGVLQDEAVLGAEALQAPLGPDAPRPLVVVRHLHGRVHQADALERRDLGPVGVGEEDRVGEVHHGHVVRDGRADVLRRPLAAAEGRQLGQRLRVLVGAHVGLHKCGSDQGPRHRPAGGSADSDLGRHKDRDPKCHLGGDEVGERNSPVAPKE